MTPPTPPIDIGGVCFPGDTLVIGLREPGDAEYLTDDLVTQSNRTGVNIQLIEGCVTLAVIRAEKPA